MKNIEYKQFESALRQVLSVSKKELEQREIEYKAERSVHPKRGPKPKHPSASDHASGNSDNVQNCLASSLPVSSL